MAEIAIIIPVYNVEHYLRQCVDSILNQSFSDYELILIDDGSTDSSGKICDEYAEQYPAVRVIHQKNSGQASARNAGIRQTDAEWIMFVDSDDVIHPRLLEYLYRAAVGNGTEISACFRDETNDIPDEFQEISFRDEVLPVSEKTLIDLLESKSAYNSIFWVVYAKLIKKSIIISHMFTVGRIFEDNEVTGKWLTEAGTISIVPEHLYYYRNNPAGTMNQPFSRKKLDFLWALEELLTFFDRPGFRAMQGKIARDYVFSSVWMAERVKNEMGDPALAREVIRKATRIQNRYAAQMHLTDEEKRKLFKAAHPMLHRIKKKLAILRKH